MVPRKGVKVGGVVPAAGGRQGNIHIHKSQCGPPEVGINSQNFRCVEVGTPWGGKKRGTEEEEVD